MEQSIGYAPTNDLTANQSKMIVISTGLALFAMFFGAGNMVFPLFLGANAGPHIILTALLFLITGVGMPFLGLVAISLYRGDYINFFSSLGKIPGFLVIMFILLVIGPLAGAPRTEVITYESLYPFLPSGLNNSAIFSLIFCSLVFLLTYRDKKVIAIIGYYITPVKLFLFSLLIIVGIMTFHPANISATATSHITYHAINMGYGTMDMLAAFFFSTVAFRAVKHNVEKQTAATVSNDIATKLLLRSCVIGGLTLVIVYLGFILVAYFHGNTLQNVAIEKMIQATSDTVLGDYGAFFVGLCVTFACLATAVALSEVATSFLHEYVFYQKVPKIVCLAGVISLMFIMTQFGFDGIMKISYPILKVIYPALIVLCLTSIAHKVFKFKNTALPAYIVAVVLVLYSLYYI